MLQNSSEASSKPSIKHPQPHFKAPGCTQGTLKFCRSLAWHARSDRGSPDWPPAVPDGPGNSGLSRAARDENSGSSSDRRCLCWPCPRPAYCCSCNCSLEPGSTGSLPAPARPYLSKKGHACGCRPIHEGPSLMACLAMLTQPHSRPCPATVHQRRKMLRADLRCCCTFDKVVVGVLG